MRAGSKMRLQYEITLFIFVILLVVGIAGAAVMLRFQQQAAIAQYEESAMTVAEIFRDSLEHEMTEGNPQHVQEVVADYAAKNIINGLVIISAERKVFASGDVSEIGSTRYDPEIVRALSSGETIIRTEERYGQNEFGVIYPVMNKPQCQGCHGAEKEILGVIEIGLNRSSIDDQIKDQILIMALIGGLTFIAVGAALAFMLRSAVMNPLSKLAASASRLARGDFSARAEVEGKDEVSMVAHTFNDMAERVEQYAGALEESKTELEQRVEERTRQVQQLAVVRGQLLERLISAQEEERRRVARELHDEAGQSLTVLMTGIGKAIDALPEGATEANEELSRSHALAAQTLAELRKLIYDLRPEVLDQLGLVPALRSYIKRRLDTEKIKLQLNFSGVKERLSPEVEITLFRIIQEAVTNIVRHAEASVVKIEVAAKNSMVTTIIEDNGKGFDVEAAFESPESWGLRGMRERVTIVGGKLSIESRAGGGTRLKLQIPLESV